MPEQIIRPSPEEEPISGNLIKTAFTEIRDTIKERGGKGSCISVLTIAGARIIGKEFPEGGSLQELSSYLVQNFKEISGDMERRMNIMKLSPDKKIRMLHRLMTNPATYFGAGILGCLLLSEMVPPEKIGRISVDLAPIALGSTNDGGEQRKQGEQDLHCEIDNWMPGRGPDYKGPYGPDYDPSPETVEWLQNQLDSLNRTFDK